MSEESVFELEQKLRNARAELASADIEFHDVVNGMSQALQVDVPPELEEAASSNVDDDTIVQEIANYLMNHLREAADRHQRAAQLVAPEDASALKVKLAEEEAAWVGEGGDEFAEFLRAVGYHPQPKASVKNQSDSDSSDEDNAAAGGNSAAFNALDKVHDVVLNLRDEEIRCFFSGDDGNSEQDRNEAGSVFVVGSAKMSLESLRHMAEFSEDELPIFTNESRQQIGTLQADIIPLAEDGSFPPFADQESNPFVNSPDELVGRNIRFAIRVRSITLDEDEQEPRVIPALHQLLAANAELVGKSVNLETPPGFFVRYKVSPSNLLLPNHAETHKSVESGATRSAFQSINHVEEWTHHAVDESFLEQLASSEVQFEICICSVLTQEEEDAENQRKEERRQQREAEKARKSEEEPKTLRELIELRADKHIDLKRRLEAEILREITEAQRHKDEEQQFVTEFRAAFNEDMKHLRRTTEKLREMLKEGLHHKSRGTAKQMTAEHALKLQEARNDLKRRMEEKLYSKLSATNRIKSVELENIRSEIINLKKRKQSTFEACDNNEKETVEQAKEAEKRLSDAIAIRDALQKELLVISNVRADINLRHTQARKTLFDEHHNEHVRKQHQEAVKRYISNSVSSRASLPTSGNNNNGNNSNNTNARGASVVSNASNLNGTQKPAVVG